MICISTLLVGFFFFCVFVFVREWVLHGEYIYPPRPL